MRLFNNEKKIIVLSKRKTAAFMIYILIIALIILFFRVFSTYSAQLREMMKNKSNNLFQSCVNNAVVDTQKAKHYNFVDVSYNDGIVSAINYNSQEINNFKAEVMQNIFSNINNKKISFRVYLSDAFQNPLFVNKGPYFDVYCMPDNRIKIECYSKFENAGINQTKNSIWLEVITDVYTTSEIFDTINTFKYTLLVSETIIVGNVPESYTNVTGDEQIKDTVLNLQ